MEITIMWLQKYGSKMEDIYTFAGRFGKKAWVGDVVHWLNNEEREDLASWLLSREINMTKEMLRHGASIRNNRDKPLFLAISEGNLEMTKFLLENGAYPYFSQGSGLSIAREKGYFEILKVLMKHEGCSDKEIALKMMLENKDPKTNV